MEILPFLAVGLGFLLAHLLYKKVEDFKNDTIVAMSKNVNNFLRTSH